jgi:hypothetical protein
LSLALVLWVNLGTGHMILRDGATFINDPIEYGQEWQVNHDDPQLFCTIDGPHFPLEQCKIPSSFQTTKCQRRLGDSSVVKHSDAEKTCCDHICNQDDFDACVCWIFS